jgi:hypothetical protein
MVRKNKKKKRRMRTEKRRRRKASSRSGKKKNKKKKKKKKRLWWHGDAPRSARSLPAQRRTNSTPLALFLNMYYSFFVLSGYVQLIVIIRGISRWEKQNYIVGQRVYSYTCRKKHGIQLGLVKR